jgi:4-cresol dehydrogenase (hydroxylating)
LIISGTGGPIDSSLIGNALERGLGTGLYADRFSSACGMEIVLPDGNIISSGFKRFGHAPASNVCKWGHGTVSKKMACSHNQILE